MIKQGNSYLADKSELSETVNKVISKHSSHLSILLINDKIKNPASFSFKEASLSNIEKGVKKSQYKKASTFGNIPRTFWEQVKKVVLKL